jgi:hypothetical protein
MDLPLHLLKIVQLKSFAHLKDLSDVQMELVNNQTHNAHSIMNVLMVKRDVPMDHAPQMVAVLL